MTLTVPPSSSTPDTQRSLANATLCLSLELSSFGDNAKIDDATVQSEIAINTDREGRRADKRDLRFGKKILRSEHLTAIYRHDIETRSYLRTQSLPSIFRGGVYLVPARSVERLVNWLKNERAPRRQVLVDAFIADYPRAIAAARESLGVTYNPENYPDPISVRESFSLTWQTFSFETPSRLKDISASFFAEERQRAESRFREAEREVRAVLRQQMADLVGDMVNRLTPDADGKRKRFHASSFEKTSAWLEAFAERNVLGDEELASLVGRARDIMSGADVEALKEDEAFRNRVNAGFSALRAELASMITTDRRVISLDEAEDAPAAAPIQTQGSDASAAA